MDLTGKTRPDKQGQADGVFKVWYGSERQGQISRDGVVPQDVRGGREQGLGRRWRVYMGVGIGADSV